MVQGVRNHNGVMKARLLAFVIWAAVAASAMYWALRLAGGGMSAPSHTVSVAGADTPRGDWSRLFVMGAAPAASDPAPVQDAAAASRFRLVGVAAPRWAVIAVDGKPARSVAVGAAIDGDWVVQKIQAKEVAIGPRGEGAVVTLALASLPPAATGSLPPSGNPGVATVGRPALFPAAPPPLQQAPPVTASFPPAPDAMAPGAILPAPPKLPGSTPGESNQDPNTDAPPVMPTLQR
jgi:general secretion pathway protein C